MLPILPRTPAGSIALRASTQSSQCLARTFTTTQVCRKIGPESPKFIEIPRPVQPFAKPHRDIKGTLPPPRNLFPKRAGDKTSPEYLAAATPEPTAAHHLSAPQTPYIAWKRRMADIRRQNLREGLVELHERKVRNERSVATKSLIRRENRERRVHAPIREDERLTNPTITAAMSKLTIGNLEDPDRQSRLQAMRQRIDDRNRAIEDQRRDALHTLYMNARSFITDEQHLQSEIDKVFNQREGEFGRDADPTSNIWEVEGAPPTVQEMLSSVNKTQKTAMAFHERSGVSVGKRMKRIAEELTGGKMD